MLRCQPLNYKTANDKPSFDANILVKTNPTHIK